MQNRASEKNQWFCMFQCQGQGGPSSHMQHRWGGGLCHMQSVMPTSKFLQHARTPHSGVRGPGTHKSCYRRLTACPAHDTPARSAPWLYTRKPQGAQTVRSPGKRKRGSVSTPGARRASFFDHSPPVPVFAPTSPNNLEYLLAVSKNLAHPLHPVYDDGKGGGWKWWE